MVSSFPKILRSSASFSQSIRNRVRLKKLQAQAKNFCRVLDIRVPQIMETEVGESGVFRDRFETVCNVVRCQPHSISGCLPAKVNTKL